jgi:hypothetical protein
MADDEDDHDFDVQGFAEAVRLKMRGASDYWYWRNKPEMEVGAAREVLTCAGVSFSDLRAREKDPPDCEAVIDEALAGIEVTELVHQRALKATIKGNPKIFMWERDDLLRSLQQIISRKDRAPESGAENYANYILVIVTDEFALGQADVARFLEGAVFRAMHITDAFLGLSYDPSIEGGKCPVFKLQLSKIG